MKIQRSRVLPLGSVRNCRELGGYYTKDHRQIRWNCLIRSTDLHKISKKDADYLWRYGVRTIVDFRSKEESLKAPDRRMRNAKHYHLPITETGWKHFLFTEDFGGKLFSGLIGQNSMHTLYKSFVNDERARKEFTRFFKVLLCRPTGVLYHCVAGKDRTGFATALLLYLFGVPEEVIVQDYLLTNHHLPKMTEYLKENDWVQHHMPFVIDTIENVFSVQPEYLYSAQQEAVRCYGSVDNYIVNGLHISQREQELLRDKFLKG